MKPRRTRERWTTQQLEDLQRLAAEQKLQGGRIRWDHVAPMVGHPAPSCQTKLWDIGQKKRQREERVHQAGLRRKAAEMLEDNARPEPEKFPLVAKVANPEYARSTSTAMLVMDAELRARIEVQGITAGLQGDPMPGRSALDKIRNGEISPPAYMDGRARRFMAKVTLATEPMR